MTQDILEFTPPDYAKLETAKAKHDHFVELEKTYGHHDAVAIFTAEVWAKLLFESLTSKGVGFEARLPDLREFGIKLTDLRISKGWRIGRNLGSYAVGDELCLVPNYSLYNINVSSQIHNPSFQRVQVVQNNRGEDVSLQSLSHVWKFAGPDGKTDYLDLGNFKSLYESQQLQLIGVPREGISFEGPDFLFTIAPMIPLPPTLA